MDDCAVDDEKNEGGARSLYTLFEARRVAIGFIHHRNSWYTITLLYWEDWSG